MDEDFFTEKVNEAIKLSSGVSIGEAFSYFKENEGKNIYRLLLFLLEAFAPILYFCFPSLLMTLVISTPVLIFMGMCNRNVVSNITTTAEWIGQQRPIVMWLLCYNLDLALQMIATYGNIIVMTLSQMYLLDYFFMQ